MCIRSHSSHQCRSREPVGVVEIQVKKERKTIPGRIADSARFWNRMGSDPERGWRGRSANNNDMKTILGRIGSLGQQGRAAKEAQEEGAGHGGGEGVESSGNAPWASELTEDVLRYVGKR